MTLEYGPLLLALLAAFYLCAAVVLVRWFREGRRRDRGPSWEAPTTGFSIVDAVADLRVAHGVRRWRRAALWAWAAFAVAMAGTGAMSWIAYDARQRAVDVENATERLHRILDGQLNVRQDPDGTIEVRLGDGTLFRLTEQRP